MKNPVPVMSPLRSYDRRGVVVFKARRKRHNSLNAHRLRTFGRLRRRQRLSRDLPSPAHPPLHPPAYPHDTRPHRLLAIALLLLASTAAAAQEAASSERIVILHLPESVGLIAAVILIAGTLLGIFLSAAFLRAADTVAARYHRAVIAQILDRSSVIHRLVLDIIANADMQIAQLRWELEALKEAQS